MTKPKPLTDDMVKMLDRAKANGGEVQVFGTRASQNTAHALAARGLGRVVFIPNAPEPSPQVLKVARAFCGEVRRELTVGVLAEVVDRNRVRNDSSCATHDFRDANELMAAAFERVMEHGIDPNNDADCAVWNAAWDIAKDSRFTLEDYR